MLSMLNFFKFSYRSQYFFKLLLYKHNSTHFLWIFKIYALKKFRIYIRIIEAEVLVAATREIGLEVSADKTKYMVMSRDQNAGRIHSVRNDNITFERVEEFKY